MQLIIPMSGLGKRFVEAGYALPKPMISVDGFPMIKHVVDLFPKYLKYQQQRDQSMLSLKYLII